MSTNQSPIPSQLSKRPSESIGSEVATKKQKTDGIDYRDSILLDVNHNYEQEERLAKQLRQCYDKKGQKFQGESATILHQLGNIYETSGSQLVGVVSAQLTTEFQQKVSTGMICWIQCATLYNAALARLLKIKGNVDSFSDLKTEIEKDLNQLCSNILAAAGAKCDAVNLCERATTVKHQVDEFRTKISKNIDNIPKIPKRVAKKRLADLEKKKIDSVIKIQQEMTADYKQIMSGIADFCQKVMGDPPCKFSIVGMGSLAREEITPYSEFEHIILLENSVSIFDEPRKLRVFKYFRWFSVMFNVMVINLQETIVPYAGITNLNSPLKKEWNWFYDDVTTHGICFDKMSPNTCKLLLTRLPIKGHNWCTDLIKPVKKMLDYLNSEVKLKSGYRLVDTAMKACFVYGDNGVYKEFQSGILKVLKNEKSEEKMKHVVEQITADIRIFATKFNLFKLYSATQLNVKAVAFQSVSIFLAALGKVYDIHDASSCFDIISKLREKQKITRYAEHKLMFAFAVGCEILLRWYMKSKGQVDFIKSQNRNRSPIEAFCNIVGKPSTLSFLQIAYALQFDISNHLNLKKNRFHSNPHLFILSILYCFNDSKKTNSLIHDQKWDAGNDNNLITFDDCLQSLLQDDSLTDCQKSNENVNPIAPDYNYFCDFGKLLQKLGSNDDAVELHRKCLQRLTDGRMGTPMNILTHETSAKKYLDNLLKWVKLKSWPLHECKKIAETLVEIGRCLFEMRQLSCAVVYFKTCLEIRETSIDVFNSQSFVSMMYMLGQALCDANKPTEAEAVLTRSLRVLENSSKNIHTDMNYASARQFLGKVLLETNFSEAEVHLKKSLSIAKAVSEEERKHAITCEALQLAGECLLDLKEPSEAQKQFDKLLEIKQRFSINTNPDKSNAKALCELGQCLLHQNKSERAIESLNQSKSITEQLNQSKSCDVETYSMLSKTNSLLGLCYLKLDKATEALEFFEKSLRICEEISPNTKNDLRLSDALQLVARCYIDMKKPGEARRHLWKCQKIIEQASLNIEADPKLANLFEDIGRSYAVSVTKKTLWDDYAYKYFEKSLAIYEKISSGKNDQNISVKLLQMGQCLLDVEDRRSALKCFKRCLEIQQTLQIDDLSIGTTYHKMGQCATALNSTSAALDFFQKSLHLKKQSTDATDLSKVVTMNAISLCLVQMKKQEEAIIQMKQAQQILEQVAFNNPSFTV